MNYEQDWNVITFSKKDSDKKIEQKQKNKIISQKQTNIEDIKIEAPKNLGKLISQARIAKGINSQKELGSQLSVSEQIINKWENNTLMPSNSEIANIERKLGVKLPRNKKIKNVED